MPTVGSLIAHVEICLTRLQTAQESSNQAGFRKARHEIRSYYYAIKRQQSLFRFADTEARVLEIKLALLRTRLKLEDNCDL